MTFQGLKQALAQKATPERKKSNEWFFKTGPGQYGEGDVFIGVCAPEIRAVAQEFITLSFDEIVYALKSPIHEERMCGLFILVNQYQKAKTFEVRKAIYEFYLDNIDAVNNWDLVDTTVQYIIGAYLFETGDYQLLYQWITDKNLWKCRIALLATFYFIRQNQFIEILELVEQVLADKQDLIHKASGWMLREVGKRDLSLLEKFLNQHYKTMPRTMLRYAIEKLDESKRQDYLKG